MMPSRSLACAGMQVNESNEKDGGFEKQGCKAGVLSDRNREVRSAVRPASDAQHHLSLSYLSHNYSFLLPRRPLELLAVKTQSCMTWIGQK